MTLLLLKKYLPENSFYYVSGLISKENIRIKIGPARKTRLGSFRPGNNGRYATINISGTLNPYSFLITLLHELAHLAVWKKHGRKALPHGMEWKVEFIELMIPVLKSEIFPGDVLVPLSHYMENPGASTNRSPALTLALKQFDPVREDVLELQELPDGEKFLFNGNRVFKKLHKVRTRYLCAEVKTNRKYSFSPLAEIKKLGS